MVVGRRRKRKLWYPVMFLVLLVIAVGVGYKVWEVYFKDTGSGEIETVGGSESVVDKVEDAQKVDDGGGSGDDAKQVEEKREEALPFKSQYEGEDPNVSEKITGAITYAGVNDGTLMIRVNIDQYLSGGGCVLDLAQGEKSLYTEKVGVVDSVATATCEGFNVPVERVGGTGKINIRIAVISGGKSGIIDGEVSL